jgi:hypothetical protein
MGGSQVAASQCGLSCQKKFPACLQYTLPSSLIQQKTLQINSQRMIKKLSPLIWMTKENNLSILVSKLPILYRSLINYIVYLRQPTKVKLHTGGMPTRKWFVSFLDLWWGSSAQHIVIWIINLHLLTLTIISCKLAPSNTPPPTPFLFLQSLHS